METEILTIDPRTERQGLRAMAEDAWIERYASGTLRKNRRLGFSWRSQYLHERIAWDYGDTFEILPRSRVVFGDPITEPDCSPLTEAGWFIDRYFTLNKANFPDDYYECKYVTVTRNDNDETHGGVGIIVRTTCAPWLPTGHILFAIVARWNPLYRQFENARNPL